MSIDTNKLTNVNAIIELIASQVNNEIMFYGVSKDEESKLGFIQKQKFETAKSRNIDFTNEEIFAKFGTKIKVGKFLKNYCDDNFDDEDILKISEIWNRLTQKSTNKFLVTDRIKHFYFEDNYSSKYEGGGGTLYNSCMRYENCQEYLEFYEKNGVKMLVMLDSEDKVLARALYWNFKDEKMNVKNEDLLKYEVLIDRIYSIDEKTKNEFINYCFNHNWLILENQAYRESYGINRDCNKFSLDLTFDLQCFNNEMKFPYVDTFQYFFPRAGLLATAISKNNVGGGQYFLDNTGGQVDDYTISGTAVFSGYLECYIEEDDAVYSELMQSYLRYDDCYYSNNLSDYYVVEWINNNDNYVYLDYKDDYFSEEDCVYCESENCYVLDVDAVYIKHLDEYFSTSYVEENFVYVNSEDDYFLPEFCVYSEALECFILEAQAIFLESKNDYFPFHLAQYVPQLETYVLKSELIDNEDFELFEDVFYYKNDIRLIVNGGL